MKTLVLGLGNPLLGDDSAGLQVINRIRPQLTRFPGVEIDIDYWGGLRLMERLVGYDQAIIVDALCSGGPPGRVSVLAIDDIPTRHCNSAHDVDLLTGLELGRRLHAKLPNKDCLKLVAIEADDVETFCEDCTPAVEVGIQRAAHIVLQLLSEWRLAS